MPSLLFKLNPTTKIWLMIFLFLPITFSYDLYFTPILFILLSLAVYFFAKELSVFELLFKIKGIFLASFLLIIFLLLTRGFHNEEALYQIWIFGFSKEDIELAFSLGFRMITFAYITVIFISTTDSVDLILSLIHQWNFPYEACYAFLAAYRFAPTFGDELQKIRTAHESRGLGTSNNPFMNMLYTPRYLIPLLISAIRKGERVAIAMDAKAFASTNERTYYKETKWEKRDSYTLIIGGMIILLVLFLTIYFDVFTFSLSMNRKRL